MIENVLIVEDELDIRFLLKKYFNKKGLSVLEADTLSSATDQLGNITDKTLVTLDLNLPDGNGFSFLEKLKHLNKNCRVIVCSAYSDMATKAITFGADAFIGKPLKMSKFDDILEHGLGK